MSGNGVPKLRRFFDLFGEECTRNERILLRVAIAPHAGARIETLPPAGDFLRSVSHLMQVRGLKQSVLIIPDREDEIAPHAGARIETKFSACEKEG